MNYTELAEAVTAKLVARIEAGDHGKWVMPWHAQPGLLNPRNATTDAPYSGVNWLMLALTMDEQDFPTNWWGTFKQWQAAGAQVRKGEHGTQIVKWVTTKGKPDFIDDDGTVLRPLNGGPRLVPKVYTVFNAAQVDGWTAPGLPTDQQGESPSTTEGSPLAPAGGVPSHLQGDAWIAATGAGIDQGTRACYRPEVDRIELPERGLFRDPESYYGTAAHELVHWSGHASRLARDLTGRFGSDAYAAEELVAELGAAMACAHLGIAPTPRDDHAAYLASWLRIMKADAKALFATASAAAKAVAHLDAYSTATAVAA